MSATARPTSPPIVPDVSDGVTRATPVEPLAGGLEVGEARRPLTGRPLRSTRRDDAVDRRQRVDFAPLTAATSSASSGSSAIAVSIPRPRPAPSRRDDLAREVLAPPLLELAGAASASRRRRASQSVFDTLASHRLGQDDPVGARIAGRATAHRGCRLSIAFAPGWSILLIAITSGNLHDPRLQRLHGVARARHQDEHDLVGDAHHLDLALTCADRLEEDDVRPAASSSSRHCSAASARPPACPRVAIERMNTPGSRKWPARRIRSPRRAPCVKGLDGIDGDDPDRQPELADMPDERTDQRRLPDPGRPGEADRERRSRSPRRAPGRRRAPRLAVLDHEITAREGPAVARPDAGDELSWVQERRAIPAPLYGTKMSVSDSRHTSPSAVGSSPDAGALTAQFAIVGLPGTAGTAMLLLARLISALGTWTAFFAVRIALYQQTSSVLWVSVLLFCRARPGRHPRHRRRPADRPLDPEVDDGLLRPRRRSTFACSPSSTRPPGSARSPRWRASRPRSSARAAIRPSRTSYAGSRSSRRTRSSRARRISPRWWARSWPESGSSCSGRARSTH